MPGVDGSSILLFVEQSPGAGYVAVGSQSNLGVNRKLSALDVSDKLTDDKQYIGGERDSDLTLDAFYVAGDVGQVLLKNAYLTKTFILVERIEGGPAGAPLEHALALVTGIDEAFKKATPGTWKVTLKVSNGWQPGAGA